MCKTWTLTRLVKFRDSISCFLVCRLPSDVEAASQSTVVTRHMVFDNKNKKRVVNGVYNDRLSQPSRKGNKKKHLNNHTRRDKDGVSSGEPSLPDDDYIIFCFTENGEFDIVRDGRGASSDALTGLPRIFRPVNRKLNYSEEIELANKLNIQKERPHLNQCDPDTAIPSEEEEEKEIIDMNKQQMRDSFKMAGQNEDAEELPIPKLSAESRLPSHSDSSRDSFAFPAYRLGWEWIGSPVPMPKSEGAHRGKKKVRRVRLQCC
ncbi:hypothetical protein L6164_011278 [Bauhinia variegata]|uniref:Uncharacterized protein n=1 Tax=Bauhinia variegata TaxID=167791 RepID=A0ACB9PAL8_BAUVA|nr:hypothetical protein L6164_011278 [Bauhinia variegata]